MAGAGLGGVCVLAKGRAGVKVTVTARDGRYNLADLAAGRYAVKFADCRNPGAYFSLWYSGHGGSLAPVAGALVVPGQLAQLWPVTLRPTNPIAAVAASLAETRRAFARAMRASLRHRPVISGTVRSSATGKGLAGICVSVVPVWGGNPSSRLLMTGSGGRYSVPGALRPGRYRVGFSIGCRNHGNYAPQWWKDAPTQEHSTILRIHKGSSFGGIDARLHRGGSISGVVRGGSRAGPGIRNVCIQLVKSGPVDPNEGAYEQGSTGAGGKYRLIGLPAGKYQLQFDPTCGGFTTTNYLPENYPGRVRVTAGNAIQGISMVLPKAGAISGTVTARDTGKPVAGICVIAGGQGPNDNAASAATATPVTVAAGTVTRSIDPGGGRRGSAR